jgi:hypothetical protein
MKLLGIGDSIVDNQISKNIPAIEFESNTGVVRNVIKHRNIGAAVVVRYGTKPGQGRNNWIDITYTLPEIEELLGV